jgi:hypothetical protein
MALSRSDRRRPAFCQVQSQSDSASRQRREYSRAVAKRRGEGVPPRAPSTPTIVAASATACGRAAVLAAPAVVRGPARRLAPDPAHRPELQSPEDRNQEMAAEAWSSTPMAISPRGVPTAAAEIEERRS